MTQERGSVKRLLISLMAVSLTMTGLASPSAATDGYPPPPPPEECEPDCPPPPPVERYVCPKDFARVPLKVELDQAREVGHQFLVGGKKVAAHAGLETQKYLLVEVCIEHVGEVVASVVQINPAWGKLQVLGMCDDGTRGSQTQLALGLQATAGPRGGTIRITGQVLASSQDFVDVGVDGVALDQEAPPVEVRLQESHDIDVPPYKTENVEIRHGICLRWGASS
jgi:hypothetical protein